MKKTKILSRISITTAVMLGCASTSFALPITVYTGFEGGSGDVDNVLYQINQTGTTVNATLNTGDGFAVIFTSSTSLSTAGGQAHLTASGGGSFTDLCFSLADGATFTKLQLNPDAVADGFITFTVDYIMPGGTFNSASFDLDQNGQNRFTIIASEGALMTEVCWTSTVGIVDANQYRVGGAAPSAVPDGGMTLIMLGSALAGLGSIRRFIKI